MIYILLVYESYFGNIASQFEKNNRYSAYKNVANSSLYIVCLSFINFKQ